MEDESILAEEDRVQGPKKPAGIKDIAVALGLSIGTVDRALHGRQGINAMTRSRVLSMAQTLGYRPNVAARNLKLKRKIRIAVHLPREIAAFFDILTEGIREAAAPFLSTVELEFRTHSRLGVGDVDLIRQALEEQTNGIILAPGHPNDLKPWIRKAARNHIPVVCVATDAPKTERLTAVSTDPYTSGAIVAELFLRTVRNPGLVLVVTGDLSTYDHAEKLRGFKEFLGTSSHLTIQEVIQAHDDRDEAYKSVSDCLGRATDVRAVYASTANSMPVIRAIEEAGRLSDMIIMTTDLFPELIPLIRSGKVLGTVYQRPQTQGRMAFQALYQFLVEGKCPATRLRLAPHIILRSNLNLFLEIQPVDIEKQVSGKDLASL
jgi:LacI family transcriptional regulator